jgi:flagellar export protein FliJ
MNQRARVAEELERRRETLVEADREVKVLEKLKAARRAEYDQAERRAEVKRLDEAAGRIRSEEVEA